MSIVQVQNISLRIGNNEILRDISFEVSKGQTLCIIGSSGSGKTTLLKTINRLLAPDSGTVRVFGFDVRESEPHILRRKIGYVLQQPALFPHWNVAKNIGLVHRLNGYDANKIAFETTQILDLVGLDQTQFSERFPHELSGGQQQRVGIARALIANPKLVLYDEPFSALDPISRDALQQTMLSLKEKLSTTTIFVTHDVNEAFLLADEIMVLRQGKIVQLGTPEEIKSAPVNEYVTQFISGLHA